MKCEIKRITNSNQINIKKLYQSVGDKIDYINDCFFTNKDNVFLVSYIDGVPTGFLYAYQLAQPHKKKPQIFLYSIDVLENYQHQGVGTVLLKYLKDFAIQQNCEEIFVLTNDANERAKGLYEKVGGKRVNLDDVMYVYDLQTQSEG